jgi:quercetin dioxygenase-like cupin family protein
MKCRHITLLMCSIVFTYLAQAAEVANGPLFNIPLDELPDNAELLVVEVNLEPGQESAPHRHNATVFVYVLEGTVNMQVAGGPLRTLSAGETFSEKPTDVHTVSRNASDTEPAKFLAYIIKTLGSPVTNAVQ